MKRYLHFYNWFATIIMMICSTMTMSAQTKVTSLSQLKIGSVIKIYPKDSNGTSLYGESNLALACSGDGESLTSFGWAGSGDSWTLVDAGGGYCYLKNNLGCYWAYQSRTTSSSLTCTTSQSSAVKINLTWDSKYGGVCFWNQKDGTGLNNLFNYNNQYNWWSSKYDYASDANTTFDVAIIQEGNGESVTNLLRYLFDLQNKTAQVLSNGYTVASITIPRNVMYDGIEYTVTSLGNACFKGCTNLTSVILPEGITDLGKDCFNGCVNLTRINLPNSITSLGSHCFYNCGSLTNVTLPNNITSLSEWCFGKAGLESIVIPEGVTTMRSSCFEYCAKLAKISLPSTLKSSESVFKNIPGEKIILCSAVVLPDVTGLFIDPTCQLYVPKESLEEYKVATPWWRAKSINPLNAISSIALPTGISIMKTKTTKLDYMVFPESVENKKVTWSSNAPTIASVDENSGIITAHEVGTAVITATAADEFGISASTMIYVTPLKVSHISITKELSLLRTMTGQIDATIEPELADNKSLKWMSDDENIATVTPEGIVTGVNVGTANIAATSTDGSNVSAMCKVTVKPVVINLSNKNINLKQGTSYSEQEIKVLPENYAYKAISWSSSDPSVASIDASGVIRAYKPGVATIRYVLDRDNRIYADCKVVVYATSVAYIGGICYLLDKNKLEATVTNVYGGDNTSVDAQQVAQCYSGVVNVPASTFYEDKRYTVTKVGSYAFSRQNELHSVFLPSTITSIQGYAFYKCSSFDNFDMPNTVQSLGGYAFAGCASLTDIHLSTSLESIGQYSFSECGLTQITLPESLKSINACAFRNNEYLQKVQLSESMESIGDYAFSNNAGLKEISFPKKLQSIGISAFENNPALESVTFKAEVENMSIGKNAFNQCPILNKVYIANLTNFAQTNFGNAKANPANTAQHIYDASGREIKNVVLASGIRFINSDAFNGCAYIESVEIPSTLEYIKDNIFKGCSNLRDVYCYATEVPPFAGSQDPSEMDDVFKAATLRVIYGNETAYKRDSWWGRFSQVVGCNTPIPDPVKVESITLNQTEATLKPDESIQLTALVNPDNADNKNITWTSTNEDVAMVSADGFVLAIAAGATNIVAEAADGSGVKAICKVTVEGTEVKLSEISFANSAVTIEQGKSVLLEVNYYPENATNKQLEWTSARASVATVNDKGVVTAVGEGKTIITAKSTDGTGLSINCVVTVTPSTGIGNITIGDVKLVVKDRHLKIEGLADNDIVQIINTIGFTVYKGTEHEIDLKAAGIYIIKVKGKTLKFSVK